MSKNLGSQKPSILSPAHLLAYLCECFQRKLDAINSTPEGLPAKDGKVKIPEELYRKLLSVKQDYIDRSS